MRSRAALRRRTRLTDWARTIAGRAAGERTTARSSDDRAAPLASARRGARRGARVPPRHVAIDRSRASDPSIETP
ncbi:hypothetical protein A8H35_12425 [Burkholderia thailandensis]|nr:hypothetical protein A8H35_12425 [Burkholderia thailandensis]AWY66730.1 hypothetical protein A8H36_16010 [Burkholderia thailandensis]NOK45158.1 hypothetical protein [Burkholderia thailandensis]NOK56402.1 hypothetical protein [Burkholderia thailandensis]